LKTIVMPSTLMTMVPKIVISPPTHAEKSGEQVNVAEKNVSPPQAVIGVDGAAPSQSAGVPYLRLRKGEPRLGGGGRVAGG
jgi:hypothetical protein